MFRTLATDLAIVRKSDLIQSYGLLTVKLHLSIPWAFSNWTSMVSCLFSMVAVPSFGHPTPLTSWRSADDPSPGEYTFRYLMVKGKYQQVYIFKNGSVIETRIGPYNGVEFAGLPNYKPNPFYVYKFEMVVNEKEMYLMYTYSSTYSVRALATPGGKLEVWHLNMRNGEWTQDLWLPIDNCDIYGPCGPYGSCSTLTNPNCGCLKGFERKNPQELSPDNWTSGCRRSRALDCGPREGFLKFSSMKLPDTQNAEFDGNMSLQECEVACKNNCSCTAYANPNMTSGGVGCLLWFGELIDVRVYPQNGQDLYVRVAASELLELHSSFHRKKRASIRIILAISAGLVVLGLLILALYIRSKKRRSDMERQDDIRKPLLDWPCRFHIIHGIAQGLLYLHQDSRLRVVHRDLKAGNILLDHDMNPKISDFGLARMFKEHESEAKTKRVVGTLGYISPEYATNGLFSVKSDIFSFGVLVLEIVSGNRSRGFVHEDHHDNLLEHAWRLYKAGKSLDLIDTSLGNSWCISEALQSIHIGLLCVQQRAEDRPSTRSVVGMLGGEVHYLLPSNLGSLSMGVKGTT